MRYTEDGSLVRLSALEEDETWVLEQGPGLGQERDKKTGAKVLLSQKRGSETRVDQQVESYAPRSLLL